MNAPSAKANQTVEDNASIAATINGLNPVLNATIIELPDAPKKSSKRGLADEETDMQEQYWNLKQHVDTRWILPFECHGGSEAACRMRWGTPLIVLVIVYCRGVLFLFSDQNCCSLVVRFLRVSFLLFVAATRFECALFQSECCFEVLHWGGYGVHLLYAYPHDPVEVSCESKTLPGFIRPFKALQRLVLWL